jgi:hypothetical protein
MGKKVYKSESVKVIQKMVGAHKKARAAAFPHLHNSTQCYLPNTYFMLTKLIFIRNEMYGESGREKNMIYEKILNAKNIVENHVSNSAQCFVFPQKCAAAAALCSTKHVDGISRRKMFFSG